MGISVISAIGLTGAKSRRWDSAPPFSRRAPASAAALAALQNGANPPARPPAGRPALV